MFEEVARGVYLEGLCVDARSAWVADPIAGGVRRCHGDGTVEAWLRERKWIESLLRGPGESILVSGEDIIRLDGVTGTHETVLDSLNGAPLTGVNELVADAWGRIYFGTNDLAAIARGEQTAPASLWRLDPDGRVTELVGGLRFSNGVALSPDGKRLYHNETFVGTSVYGVRTDGSLGEGRRLLDKPDCDGIAVSADGTVWITGFLAPLLVRLAPDDTELEPFAIPGGGATNVRFGGTDMRDLYVTTVAEGAAMKLARGEWPTQPESVLYRTRVDQPGLALHRAT